MKNELVKIENKEILCDSRVIAKKFDKSHKHVLEKIDSLKKDMSILVADNSATKDLKFNLIFVEKTRKYRGQDFRYVEMNKPAYSLVAMGFSGLKALEIKLLFNDAFYRMEDALLRIKNQKKNLEWNRERTQGKSIRIGLTGEIKTFIDYALSQGANKTGANFYYSNITKMQYKALGLIEKNEKIDKNFRDTLNVMDLHNLITAEYHARQALSEGMRDALNYKDIFQLAKQRVMNVSKAIVIDRLKLF